MAYLAALPKGPALVNDTLEICHGSPFDEDHYVFDQDDAARSIDAASARVCLFGHTHLPAVFTAADDPATTGNGLAEDEMRLPASGPALINVGSVGQPRDGDPRAAYGLIDLERGHDPPAPHGLRRSGGAEEDHEGGTAAMAGPAARERPVGACWH